MFKWREGSCWLSFMSFQWIRVLVFTKTHIWDIFETFQHGTAALNMYKDGESGCMNLKDGIKSKSCARSNVLFESAGGPDITHVAMSCFYQCCSSTKPLPSPRTLREEPQGSTWVSWETRQQKTVHLLKKFSLNSAEMERKGCWRGGGWRSSGSVWTLTLRWPLLVFLDPLNTHPSHEIEPPNCFDLFDRRGTPLGGGMTQWGHHAQIHHCHESTSRSAKEKVSLKVKIWYYS